MKRTVNEMGADNIRSLEDENGIKYKVGCNCITHSDRWICCTMKKCANWYCEAYIAEQWQLNDDELQELRDDDHLFVCHQHG